MQDNILEIHNLVTSFASDGRKDRAIAVNGVDIAIPKGSTVGLVGESGCGSTAARARCCPASFRRAC